MLKIRTPASSANLGPGFDCLGLALDIYNTFTVERSDRNTLINVEERFVSEDNLFLQAWRKGCEAIGSDACVRAEFNCDIPVSRGLGSSAAMIIGGLTAASVLHDDALSEQEIFTLAAEMEGHPDNVAACLFGGLTASFHSDDSFIARNIPLHERWKTTVLIPDFEVSTEKARTILPDSYSRSTAAYNSAAAILTVEALRSGDTALLKTAARDHIHELYRKELIPGYDRLKEITENDAQGVLLISGSGSTCLLISAYDLSERALNAVRTISDHRWTVRKVSPALSGTEVRSG